MIVKISKGARKNIPSYGKYTAKALHLNTITLEDVCSEVERNCSMKSSDVQAVLRELLDVLKHHLQQGNRVQLPPLGTMKLDLESGAFDDPAEFSAAKHIKRCKVSFIPTSYRGRQPLLDGVTIDKVLTDD